MVSLGTQIDFGGNSLKLFRIISVMIIQTKCKENNAELFLKIHSEQRNWKQKVLRGKKRT